MSQSAMHRRRILKPGLALMLMAAVAYSAILLGYRSYKIGSLEVVPQPRTVLQRSSRCSALLLGDSRVTQWPLPVIDGWTLSKTGLSGGGTKAILGAATVALRDAPNLLIVQAGINDVSAAALSSKKAGSRIIEEAASNLVSLAVLAKRQGVEQIVVTSVPAPARVPLWQYPLYRRKHLTYAAVLNQALSERLVVMGIIFYPIEHVILSTDAEPATHWTRESYDALNSDLAKLIGNSSCESRFYGV